jgi:hypothetical protein
MREAWQTAASVKIFRNRELLSYFADKADCFL